MRCLRLGTCICANPSRSGPTAAWSPYLQLAENVWNAERRRSETRILCNCGRADDAAVTERLRQLAASILRRCSPEEIVAQERRLAPGVRLALWRGLRAGSVVAAPGHRQGHYRAGQSRRLGFDVERALFAMVANRACAPCSKLYCWEQWLKEEVHIPGTQGLSLQHLYRAMDFLEANKEPIEREIFHRVADLLNLDVEVLFYDTTSLHFEIDQDDHGAGRRTSCTAAWPPGASPTGAAQARPVQERAQRCAADRRGPGGHARGLPGAALGVPRQHRGREHGRAGQARPARLAAHALLVRRRRGHGLGGELQGAWPPAGASTSCACRCVAGTR